MLLEEVKRTSYQDGKVEVVLEGEGSFEEVACFNVMHPMLSFDTCADCGEDVIEYREPQFGGAYYDENGEFVYIEKVIYSKPAVIVFWNDGTKTRCTCDARDKFNPEMGLMLAVMKKITGQEFVNKLFADWLVEMEKGKKATTVTLKDVRKRHK